MREDFAPALHPVEISVLRPTQMTVGLREVQRKRADWRKRAERDGPDFLGSHMIPVILGPKSVPYVIDHHHLARYGQWRPGVGGASVRETRLAMPEQ